MNKKEKVITLTRWKEGNDWVKVLYRSGKRLQLTELLDTQYLINYIANSPYKFLFSYYSVVEGLKVVVINNTHLYISKGTIYINLNNLSEVIDIQNKTLPLPVEEGLYWLKINTKHKELEYINDEYRNPIQGGPIFGSYGMIKQKVSGDLSLVGDQTNKEEYIDGFPIALINVQSSRTVDILYIDSKSNLTTNQNYTLPSITPYVERYFFEESGDFINKGLKVTSTNNKTITLQSGVCYIDGKRIVIENPLPLPIEEYFVNEGKYMVLINSIGLIEIRKVDSSVYPLKDYSLIETLKGSNVIVDSFYYSDTDPQQNQIYIWKDNNQDKNINLSNTSLYLGLSQTGVNHLLLATVNIRKDLSQNPTLYEIIIDNEDSYRAITNVELTQAVMRLEALEKRLLQLELDKQLIAKVETNLIDKKASSILSQYSDINHPLYSVSYIESDNAITLQTINEYIKVNSADISYTKGSKLISSVHNKEVVSSPELTFESIDIAKGNNSINLDPTESTIYITLGKPNKFTNDILLFVFNNDSEFLFAVANEYINNFSTLYGSRSSEQDSSLIPKDNTSIVKFDLPGSTKYDVSNDLFIEVDGDIKKSFNLPISTYKNSLFIDNDYTNTLSQIIKIEESKVIKNISISIEEVIKDTTNDPLTFIVITITRSNNSIPTLNDYLAFGYKSFNSITSNTYIDIDLNPMVVLDPNFYSINICYFNASSMKFKCNSNSDSNGQDYTLGNLMRRNSKGVWETISDKDLNIKLNLGTTLYTDNILTINLQSIEPFIRIHDHLEWIGDKGDFSNMLVIDSEYENLDSEFNEASSIKVSYKLNYPLSLVNLDTSYFIVTNYLPSGNWISKTFDIGSPYTNVDLWLSYLQPEGSSIEIFISSNKGQEWEKLLIDEEDSSKFYLHNLTESVPYKELTEDNITILREWVTIKIILNTNNILQRPSIKDIKFVTY